eukprot:289828_1
MADSQVDLSTDSSTGSTDLVDLSDEGKAPEATVISDPQAKRKRTFLEVLSPDSARNHTVEVTLQKAPGPEPRTFELKVVSDLQLPELIAFVPKTAREQEEIGDPLSQIRFRKMEISNPDLALSEALTDVLSGPLTDQHYSSIIFFEFDVSRHPPLVECKTHSFSNTTPPLVDFFLDFFF